MRSLNMATLLLSAHNLLFWDPRQENRGRGRLRIVQSVAETQSLMNYRVLWREHTRDRAQHSESAELKQQN